MDAEEAGDLGAGLLPGADHFHGLLPLVRVELGRPPPNSALSPSCLEPSSGTLADHRSLELGKAPDHLHHHPAPGGGGVHGLGQAAKPGTCCIDLLQDVQEILEGAGEPVELPNHDDIARPKLIEEATELGAVPPSPGRLLLEHPDRAGLPKGLVRVSFRRGAAHVLCKAEIVKLVRTSGKTVGQAARELELTETAVRAWMKAAEVDDGNAQVRRRIEERLAYRRTDVLEPVRAQQLAS